LGQNTGKMLVPIDRSQV